MSMQILQNLFLPCGNLAMDVQWCPIALLIAALHLWELDQLYLEFSIITGGTSRCKLINIGQWYLVVLWCLFPAYLSRSEHKSFSFPFKKTFGEKLRKFINECLILKEKEINLPWCLRPAFQCSWWESKKGIQTFLRSCEQLLSLSPKKCSYAKGVQQFVTHLSLAFLTVLKYWNYV